MGYEFPSDFLSIEGGGDFVRRLVALNVTAVSTVTRSVLPGMVERRRGAVVNISSMMVQVPSPLYSAYSATKAFVDNFSNNLAVEYRDRGIVVQTVLPGEAGMTDVMTFSASVIF